MPVIFAVVCAEKTAAFTFNGWVAIDYDIYRGAALAALMGGDPWATEVRGMYFAGPPPTLLPYLPIAVLPSNLGLAIVLAASIAAATFIVRRLGLSLWWLLFPPLFESVLVLNPDVFVLCFLLTSRFAAIAVVTKVYAAVPLVLQGRWRPLVLAALLASPTVLLLPSYFGGGGGLGHFSEQNAALSAWGTVWMAPVAVALVILGRQAAAWLAVPVLWPFTQLHYSTIAMPALKDRPLLTIAMSFGTPLLAPVAVVIEALLELWRRRSSGIGHPLLSARPTPDSA